MTEEDKKQAEDLKQYYKIIYKCDSCGVIYGSDKKEIKSRLCPNCEIKFKKEAK